MANQRTSDQRDSRFELLRLLAMYFIVLYHFLIHYVEPETNGDMIYRTIQIPLHIGVPVFVLISGYFGIRPSVRGVSKLLVRVAVYALITSILSCLIIDDGTLELKYEVFFLSNSHFWFVRTYFCLYLLSPLLNSFFATSSRKDILRLVLALCFVSLYIGSVSVKDETLSGGKNVVYFMTLYSIGHILSLYKDKWQRFKGAHFLFLYICLNLAMMCAMLYLPTNLTNTIRRFCFAYSGPFLVLSAILFFLWAAKFNIQSKTINSLAASSFAIYLIHESYFCKYYLSVICHHICSVSSSYLFVLFALCLLGIVVCVLCIAIDKCLAPIWKIHRLL